MLLWARVGGREAEASINDALAGVARCGICFLLESKTAATNTENAIKTQKLSRGFLLCLGLCFCFKTISQTQEQHR